MKYWQFQAFPHNGIKFNFKNISQSFLSLKIKWTFFTIFGKKIPKSHSIVGKDSWRIFILCYISVLRGVAWSSGQRRSLLPQGSRHRIPVVLSFNFSTKKINPFHVANDLSKHARHARRDEGEGPAGVSGMEKRERSTFDSSKSGMI